MNPAKKRKKDARFAIRWIARILGGVLILIVVSWLIQTGIQNPLELGRMDQILNLALLLMLAGILVAYFKEIIGGCMIIVGFLLFWIVTFIVTGQIWPGWIFPLFPITGLFFIISGRKQKM